MDYDIIWNEEDLLVEHSDEDIYTEDDDANEIDFLEDLFNIRF